MSNPHQRLDAAAELVHRILGRTAQDGLRAGHGEQSRGNPPRRPAPNSGSDVPTARTTTSNLDRPFRSGLDLEKAVQTGKVDQSEHTPRNTFEHQLDAAL